MLVSDISQFLYAFGHAAPGAVRRYLNIRYVAIPLGVWPAAPGAVRRCQALSCYLICPNSFMHLASRARRGQALSCYPICPNSFTRMASSARRRQALPKNIVNSLLTSDHIIISCFPQRSCQHYFYWTSKLTNSPS